MGELVFIGLGLYDENDITLKGLDEARRCDVLFSESYTSRLRRGTIQELGRRMGREIRVLAREQVEEGEIILEQAMERKVGFLVPGDSMSATTHVDLRIRAEKKGIKTKIIHGISIMTAACGLLGLQSYKFGRTTTIPFRDRGFFPESPYHVIKKNKRMGLHTLVLLDLKENGKNMEISEAIDYLLEIERKEKAGAFKDDDLVCALGDVGSDHPEVVCDQASRLARKKMRSQLFCLVVPGKLHFMEKEAIRIFAGFTIRD